MKITTKIVFDIDNNILEHEWFDYSGPLELADRAASNAAKGAAANAGNVAGAAESNATNEHGQLAPFFSSEMKAQHGFNPQQTNELLDYAGAGIGGTGASSTGEAASEAARTRNTSGFAPALDQNARDRAREMATVNEGVGAQDVMGAKALNQEGAAGMNGLYGADTNTMLKSMGQQNEDINTQLGADKAGWFQNLTNGIGAGAGLIGALKK